MKVLDKSLVKISINKKLKKHIRKYNEFRLAQCTLHFKYIAMSELAIFLSFRKNKNILQRHHFVMGGQKTFIGYFF